MGRMIDESYSSFLDSLKAAGVEITNEDEVRERLGEASRWRHAFMTLVTNGCAIGIEFMDQGATRNADKLHQAFAQHDFPSTFEVAFAERLTRH